MNLLQQLENSNNYVINVAESRGFKFFSMVQPPGPVDCDVATLMVDLNSALQWRSGVHAAEVVQALKHGAAKNVQYT